jgi:hypothetical protein
MSLSSSVDPSSLSVLIVSHRIEEERWERVVDAVGHCSWSGDLPCRLRRWRKIDVNCCSAVVSVGGMRSLFHPEVRAVPWDDDVDRTRSLHDLRPPPLPAFTHTVHTYIHTGSLVTLLLERSFLSRPGESRADRQTQVPIPNLRSRCRDTGLYHRLGDRNLMEWTYIYIYIYVC